MQSPFRLNGLTRQWWRVWSRDRRNKPDRGSESVSHYYPHEQERHQRERFNAIEPRLIHHLSPWRLTH